MEVIVYIAASLDGYIARPDGSLDWLYISGPEESAQSLSDFVELLGGVDGVVMGRKTFETVRHFSPWPYGALPVIVLSTTLRDVPDIEGANIQVRAGRPADLLADLETEGLSRIYVDGGETLHGFLQEGLVDHLTVATAPVLLGSGRPLFPRSGPELRLRLESSLALESGIVKSAYRRQPTEA
jgi:dihydrofolate reductase